MKNQWEMFLVKNYPDGVSLKWDVENKVPESVVYKKIGYFRTTTDFIELVYSNNLTMFFKSDKDIFRVANIAVKTLARKQGYR